MSFQAGTGEACITPPLGLPLLGSLLPNTGVNDDLWARVLVINDGYGTVAFVSLDLIGMDFEWSDRLRKLIKADTGIKTVLLMCSHTHSAPFTIPWSRTGWDHFRIEGRKWCVQVEADVRKAVKHAVRHLRKVSLSAGRAAVQLGSNRRKLTDGRVIMAPNPEGAVAPWTDVLRVDSEKGRPLAILFTHAAHPVIVHGSSMLVSADYPGFAVESLRKTMGKKVMPIFAQGCGANINAAPLRGGLTSARKAGKKLADAVGSASQSAGLLSGNDGGRLIQTASVTLQLPFQDLPDPVVCTQALLAAKKSLAETKASEQSPEMIWQKDQVLCLERLLERSQRKELKPLRFEINMIALGQQWCLMSFSHEVFVEYQLWADKMAPFGRMMTVAYTNGCEMYIPTDADLRLGGYEAASSSELHSVMNSALKYRQRSGLQIGVERQIKRAIKHLFSDLRVR